MRKNHYERSAFGNINKTLSLIQMLVIMILLF
jgi:hypothetical protein